MRKWLFDEDVVDLSAINIEEWFLFVGVFPIEEEKEARASR